MTVDIQPYDEREFVWEQKWRCNTIEEMALPSRIRDLLVGYTKLSKIPSLLLYSRSPGTGKTTTSYAVARMIGCMKPLYVNASLDTDVANIRTKVHKYATGATLGGHLKVVILDECDRLSTNAQESLKGLIEQVSRNCVFILTTNKKAAVVDPLVSRCRVIDYEFTEEERVEMIKQMTKRSILILEKENVEIVDKRYVLELVKRSFPDNRRLLSTLQDYARIFGKIDEGVLVHNQSSDMRSLIEVMRAKDFKALKQWVYDQSDVLGPQFLGDLARYLIEPKRINDTKTATIIDPSCIPDVIEFLGEEQKYFDAAHDKWLYFLRIVTVLAVSGEIKFNQEFVYAD